MKECVKVIMLIISMVANPFTLDSPNINRITATIMVVMLASKILVNDSLFPILKASCNLVPIFN